MFPYNLAWKTVHSDAKTQCDVWYRMWWSTPGVLLLIPTWNGCSVLCSDVFCWLPCSCQISDQSYISELTRNKQHRYLFLIVQILDTPWALVGPCTVCLNCKMWFLLQLYSVYKLIWFFGGVNSLRWWNNVIERLLFICTYKVAYYLCYQ